MTEQRTSDNTVKGSAQKEGEAEEWRRRGRGQKEGKKNKGEEIYIQIHDIHTIRRTRKPHKELDMQKRRLSRSAHWCNPSGSEATINP